MWFGSWRKGLCLPGKEILQGMFVYVYFHVTSSFSSGVKPFDIEELSKWDRGSNAHGGLFPSCGQNEDRMSADRCMCTPSRNMHTGSQSWRTPALRKFCTASKIMWDVVL